MIGGPTEVEVYHAPYKEYVSEFNGAHQVELEDASPAPWGPGMEEAILYPLPPPADVAPRRLTDAEGARVDLLCRLLFFLATAPTKWSSLPSSHLPDLSKFRLPNGEDVACVLWNGLYHITGTDIVRALLFRFEAFGRPVKHTKKWEEGVFSDLRNLKPGVDACLEEPKSAFLDFLFRNGCIRTQKKQKVFYWFSVPHDRLFLDALERDLKREKAGQEPTSVVVGEPARSFKYDPRRGLYEQFMGSNRGMEAAILDQVYPLQARLAPGGGMLPMDASRQSSIDPMLGYDGGVDPQNPWGGRPGAVDASGRPIPPDFFPNSNEHPYQAGPGGLPQFTVTMFEGSAAYKRKRVRSKRSSPAKSVEPKGEDEEREERDQSEMSEDKKRKIASRSSTAAPEGSTGTPSNGATDEKSFVCVFEFCRRPFKRLEHLKRHIRTHTQERPFACKLCSRAFSRQDNLLQHLRLHRKDDPPRSNDVAEDRLSAPPNTQYSVPAYNGGGMGAYRSTTVPPDWLSMPPPNAPWGTPPQPVSSHPSFSPVPQQPMRFRSATPQMTPNYSYGSMPPPPPPSQSILQPLNVATGTAAAPYPIYTAEPQSTEYSGGGFQSAGWTPVDSAMSGSAGTPLDGALDPALQGPPPPQESYNGSRVSSGSEMDHSWQPHNG